MKGLSTRVWTAIIFVGVMLGAIFGGPYSFSGLVILMTYFCLAEFYGIVFPLQAPNSILHQRLGIAIGMLPILFCIAVFVLELFPLTKIAFAIHLLLLLVLFSTLFLVELFGQNTHPFQNIGFLAVGMLYISIPLSLLFTLAFYNDAYTPVIVIGLLVMTWLNDTGAYFVGSIMGRTPLFPRISPKKTWEGSLGGVAFTFLTAYLFSLNYTILSSLNWLALAIIVAIFASMGDLVESMFKRSYQIKDSGTSLPGHGGFLDRFDAFIFMIPFATLYLWMMKG